MEYSGHSAVVVGCSSGIGAAVAGKLVRSGADVHGFDVVPPSGALADTLRFDTIDLRNSASIQRALEAIRHPVDALFNCAGLSSLHEPLDVLRVNFIGMRCFTEGLMPRFRSGGAVASVASIAGRRWRSTVAFVREFVDTDGYAAAETWAAARPAEVGAGYVLSKEACILWTMLCGSREVSRGVRFNCLCPGAVDTPMLRDLHRMAPTPMLEAIEQPIGRRSTADEQAAAMLFLNSDAASYVNGHALVADGGYSAAESVGEPATTALRR